MAIPLASPRRGGVDGHGAGDRRVRLHRKPLHPAAPGGRPPGAGHGERSRPRATGARPAEAGRRGSRGSPVAGGRRPGARRRLGRGGDRLRVRAARGVSLPRHPPQERGPADRARPPGRPPRAARLARCRREAGGADLVVRGHRLRPRATGRDLRRAELDRSERRRRATIRQIEDPGRTRRLGLPFQRGRRARARGDQPRGGVRPGAGKRLLDLHPHRAAPHGRRHPRVPAPHLRGGGRARRGGFCTFAP